MRSAASDGLAWLALLAAEGLGGSSAHGSMVTSPAARPMPSGWPKEVPSGPEDADDALRSGHSNPPVHERRRRTGGDARCNRWL
jgi:hypothetical protein